MVFIPERRKKSRRQSDEALRKSEEKYRTILENINEGYYEIDLAGNFTFFNESLCRILGYTRKEMSGINYRNYTDRETAERLFQGFNEIYRTGMPAKIVDYEITRKDKTKAFMETSVSLLKDSSGRAVGFRGLVRDVTEYKKSREELRKSEQRYKGILESIREGYFELDLEGNYIFANEANCRYLGYTKEELIGKSYKIHTTKESAEKFIKPYRGLYKTGKPIEAVELESITKDGRKLIHETYASLIRDDAGRPIGFRGVSRDITARKNMEEDLRRSEEKYRTILESIDDGYYEIDLEGNYTFFNDAETRNLGYSKEEMTGMDSRKYQDEETYKRTRKAFIDLYRTGIPIKSLEMEAIRKDGTRVFNEISASLITDKEGKPIGFRGITRNISERRKAEEALRESERKYRFLMEAMTDIVWTLDMDFKPLYVSSSIEKVLGFSMEERLRQDLKDIVTPDSYANMTNKFAWELEIEKKQQADSERTFTLEVEYYHKDGGTRWFENIMHWFRDREGKIAGIHGVSRDITERKRVEEDLRRSEERYRTILDEMEEGYFELDLAGNAVFFNDSVCRILGYPPEELLGINYKEYTDGENARKCLRIYNEIYRTGNPGKVQGYEIIRRDGTKRYLETSASLQKDSSGKIIGFRGISRDVTERKHAEEALKRNHDELIRKNIEIEESRKNVQIALERLGAAYEELKVSQAKILQQEKMASIGQLAAGVAHEINNPVSFIASNLNTLDKYLYRLVKFSQVQTEIIKKLQASDAIRKMEKKRKELKIDYIVEDIRKMVQELLDGTNRVQKIVQSLKRFSRVDDVDYKNSDINECLEQSINIVWNEIKHKAALVKEYGEIPFTKCFPQQLSQVFINLLLNAAQAITEKGEIKIKTWERDKEIWISVSDTGVGISPDNMVKIFEPFFTTKEVGKGTGLGLSISYEIVQRHGGDISFESEEGKGTTFIVRIPIVS